MHYVTFLVVSFTTVLCRMTAGQPPSPRLPRGCEKWFVFHPSRCEPGSMYLQWCRYGGPRICSVINPDAFPTEPTDKPPDSSKTRRPDSRVSTRTSQSPAATARRVRPATRATRRPVQSTPQPSRSKPTSANTLRTRANVNQQATRPPKLTGRNLGGKAGGKSARSSGEFVGASGAQKQVELFKVTTDAAIRARMADKRINDAFLKCVQQNGVAKECQKIASFNLTVPEAEQLICEKPECVVYVGEVTYCATNGKDQYHSCCKPLGIEPICEPFCNGEKLIYVEKMFPDVVATLDYFPCFEKRLEIQQCLGATHSGKLEAKPLKWAQVVVDPEIVILSKELACNGDLTK